MVENPIGDTAGGILRHVHVHGCAAGFDIKADEPRVREPVDLQQVIVILGPAGTGWREYCDAVLCCR